MVVKGGMNLRLKYSIRGDGGKSSDENEVEANVGSHRAQSKAEVSRSGSYLTGESGRGGGIEYNSFFIAVCHVISPPMNHYCSPSHEACINAHVEHPASPYDDHCHPSFLLTQHQHKHMFQANLQPHPHPVP